MTLSRTEPWNEFIGFCLWIELGNSYLAAFFSFTGLAIWRTLTAKNRNDCAQKRQMQLPRHLPCGPPCHRVLRERIPVWTNILISQTWESGVNLVANLGSALSRYPIYSALDYFQIWILKVSQLSDLERFLQHVRVPSMVNWIMLRSFGHFEKRIANQVLDSISSFLMNPDDYNNAKFRDGGPEMNPLRLFELYGSHSYEWQCMFGRATCILLLLELRYIVLGFLVLDLGRLCRRYYLLIF